MRLIKLLLFISLPFSLFSQNTIGLPDVINYNKQTYNAGLQTWDIKQDSNGIIYFANNEGLLRFDGKYWNLHPLPNKTITRSVEIGWDNNIYVGGQDEMGYFAPALNGSLEFHSLLELIPQNHKSFGDVWDIISYKRSIYFRTLHNIFKLTGNQISVFTAPREWAYMGISNGHLYAHDNKAGLCEFNGNAWVPVPGKSALVNGDPITSILPLKNNNSLITTLKNGLFTLSPSGIEKLNTANASLFASERIYAATTINDEWIALATNNSGIYIIDLKGNIIQSFARQEGLQNNNVLSIFRDRQNNLWLGLDNGIDFIAQNSAIKHIIPSGQDASGYTAAIQNNRLYIGTSNGLYSVELQPSDDLSFSKGNFLPVNNTKGQVWGLAAINGELFMGHHDGAFHVKNNNAIQISNKAGFWNFVPATNTFPVARVFSGTYREIVSFNAANNSVTETGSISGFSESARFIAIDNNTGDIWVSHPYHGVYRLSAKADGSYANELFTEKQGLPSILNNHVYKVRNEVVAATISGVYIYNKSKRRFEQSSFYKKIFGDLSLRYLKEDHAGNIWFIHEKSVGVVDMSGKEPVIIHLPELNNKMLSGFEFIYPVNESNIFLGGEKGFIHINYEKYRKSAPELKVQVRNVKIYSNTDSILFGGYFSNINNEQQQNKKNTPAISHKWKTILFEYSSAIFGYQSNLEYSYRLKGFDNNWSEWSKRTDKEYTNLPSGSYSFEVKVRNNLGNESVVSFYSFKVLPPWYATIWAYLLYIALVAAGAYTLYKFQEKKFKEQETKHQEEQNRLRYIHELERNKTESELVSLRNDKLESEISFKNSELASSAMHLVKKGELIAKIKGDLSTVIKEIDNQHAISELKKLIKTLGDDDNMDNEWEKFTQHFDKVHSDFVTSLKEKHPAITGNEIKLCAYLRMNLSTKEIAQLMNISVRGVEISRYRLRKKLGIGSEVNLFDYMMNISKE
ncbi:MAG: triple tyrosine motif-containing protein [Lacibacter sp.]